MHYVQRAYLPHMRSRIYLLNNATFFNLRATKFNFICNILQIGEIKLKSLHRPVLTVPLTLRVSYNHFSTGHQLTEHHLY